VRIPITRLGDLPFQVLTYPDDVQVSKGLSKDSLFLMKNRPDGYCGRSENSVWIGQWYCDHHSAAGVSRQA
jgi:hypothetical protein